jgi:RNA polymerase sigma-70 factor, ECF subfamily
MVEYCHEVLGEVGLAGEGVVRRLANSASLREMKDTQFVALLSDHQGRIFRYIYCLVRNLPDTEDVFQQTAVTLWNKFSEFDPTTNFSTWACAIARYKALQCLEAKGRQRLVFSEELLAELAQNDDCLPELHEARLKALARCREKLSDTDQRLLSACYGGDQPILEAAKKIGRPVGSVYDSLSRIRRALYLCIERTLTNEGLSS